VPDKFYKGGSQEKTPLLWPEFFLLPSPHDRARSVLNGRAMDSGAGHGVPAVEFTPVTDFNRIVSAVAREYGDQLVLTASTAYVDLPSDTVAELRGAPKS
jgi:hypothetical protein